MAQLKIYADENYVFVVDRITDVSNQGSKANTVVTCSENPEIRSTQTEYTIKSATYGPINFVIGDEESDSSVVNADNENYTVETWEQFCKENTGNFNSASGGSGATTEKSGIFVFNSLGDTNVIEFDHELPGANWVQVQYSNPEFGNMYLCDVSVSSEKVTITSDNDIENGSLTIYYSVKIV